MVHKKTTPAHTTAATPTYPYIYNLAFVNGQRQNHPAQYCVSRCVGCCKVRVLLVRVRHFEIIEQLAASWQVLGDDIAPNLGGTFCPNCRPPGEDWDIVQPGGRPVATIHRPSLAEAEAYLNEHRTQYQNCTLRPRAPTN